MKSCLIRVRGCYSVLPLIFLAATLSEPENNKFDALYIRYHKELFYIAKSYLHTDQAAEDAVQTAFIRVLSLMHKFTDVECSETKFYLVKIIKSVSTDMYWQQKKNHEELIEDAPGAFGGMKIIYETDMLETIIVIKELIKTLPKNYQDVLQLKISGYKYNEIADALGMTLKNVSVILTRARKKLAELYYEKQKDNASSKN